MKTPEIPDYKYSSARNLDRKKCLTEDEWNFCFVSFNFRCAVCDSADYLHGDHWIARTRGGSSLADNIVPLCRSCNHEKGASPAFGWLIYKLGDIERAREIMKNVAEYHERVRNNGMYKGDDVAKNGARKP
jgi:hypothetical protein